MFSISVAIPLVSLCGCVSLIMTIISNTFYFHSYQEEEGLRGGKGGGGVPGRERIALPRIPLPSLPPPPLPNTFPYSSWTEIQNL